MKLIKTVIIATMLILTPAYAFCSDIGYMRISLIEGDVQVKTPDAGDWGLASVNTPLAEGDQVWTPQGSRAELQLNNGTYIRLDENSALQILSMDGDSSQFYLSQGRAFILNDAPRGSVIQFDTPDASTRAFNRAIFRIDMSDRYTDVSVYKGYVESENDLGLTRINAGLMLSLGQDTNGEVAPMGPADEWEDWNYDRNERIFADMDGGARYLPAELRIYAPDLDSNGRWVYVPDYGYCWTPTVHVGVNWSPYRAGRWIWRGGDYVWVASEHWGWAPYHYGRWAFVANVGWCWVPPSAGAVNWGPGYVGWVRTQDYVAWVPLAPGEVYYGHGNYGPHSVNITNVNINRVNVTNVIVYKNVYVNNGVTVVNRNTFNTASPTIVNVNKTVIRQNIFVRNNISLGPPAIKPTRASYFASSKPVPPAKLPPRPVRNMRITELKTARPLVKAPGKSVLNRGAGAMTLPVKNVRTSGREIPTLRTLQPAERGRAGTPVRSGLTGEKPQFQPTERGKAGVPGSPVAKSERPQVQPPVKWKTGAPGGPAARMDIPQVRLTEKKQPEGPGVFGPTGERTRFQPDKNKQPEVPGGSVTNRERPQFRTQPVESAKPAATFGQGPGKERPQGRQVENKQQWGPNTPGPTGERTQFRPVEKWKTGARSGPGANGEKPQVQSAWKRQPVISPTPAPRAEKPQARPAEMGKAGSQAGPAGKEVKPRPKTEKKEKPAKPGESD